MNCIMNRNEESGRTAMIDEARALLSMIDAAHAAEEIDEDSVTQLERLTLRRKAGQLVAELIAQLQPADAVPTTESKAQFVGRLIWI